MIKFIVEAEPSHPELSLTYVLFLYLLHTLTHKEGCASFLFVVLKEKERLNTDKSGAYLHVELLIVNVIL